MYCLDLVLLASKSWDLLSIFTPKKVLHHIAQSSLKLQKWPFSSRETKNGGRIWTQEVKFVWKTPLLCPGVDGLGQRSKGPPVVSETADLFGLKNSLREFFQPKPSQLLACGPHSGLRKSSPNLFFNQPTPFQPNSTVIMVFGLTKPNLT